MPENDLEGLAAIDITSEHLEEVKKKHGFTNVAIFVPSDGDVIILNSTNEDEIGMSTKKVVILARCLSTAFKQ